MTARPFIGSAWDDDDRRQIESDPSFWSDDHVPEPSRQVWEAQRGDEPGDDDPSLYEEQPDGYLYARAMYDPQTGWVEAK